METTQHVLSCDDLELLRPLAQGLPQDAVAGRVWTSDRTVRSRAERACERVGVDGPIEAVVQAAKRGVL